MNKSITIKDIAAAAKVSVSTVSRVLNKEADVSEKTRSKIEQIIEEMNYRPSAMARGMVSKKTNSIAILVTDITNPYFYQFVAHIERQLMEKGYTLSLFDTQTANKNNPKKTVETEISIFKQIQEHHFDAVLILGGLIDSLEINEDYAKALENLARHILVIVVGKNQLEERQVPTGLIFVTRNQKLATNIMTNHLIQKGYRKIAFIGGTPSVWVTKERRETFIDVLKLNNLPMDENLIITNNFYAKNGYEGILQLFNEECDFDAVLAINDRVAQGVLRGIADVYGANKKIAVASCERFIDQDYSVPRLTTIDHNLEQLCNTTVITLMKALDDKIFESPQVNNLPQLIIGESC